MAPFLFVQKKAFGERKKMVSFPFLRKNEKIREIKSYHERKKENCKIHAFAKWGGKHYSKNHQVALE